MFNINESMFWKLIDESKKLSNGDQKKQRDLFCESLLLNVPAREFLALLTTAWIVIFPFGKKYGQVEWYHKRLTNISIHADRVSISQIANATITGMKNKTMKPDPDMEGAGAALTRAAKRAKLLAAQTGTEFVVVRDGKLVREIPNLEDVLREQSAGAEQTSVVCKDKSESEIVSSIVNPDKKKTTDPDMENATEALIRAGKRARLLAAQTGTAYVTMRDGKLIHEFPKLELKADESDKESGSPVNDENSG